MKESDLYNGIKCHNELIFQEFIDTYINLFYKIATKIMLPYGSESDIEDCICDSLTYIWFHINDHDPNKCSFRNWCSMIVHSRAYNQLRCIKRIDKKYEKIACKLSELPPYFNSAEDEFFNNTNYKNLTDAIMRLPFPTSEILIKKYIYNQSSKEIAKDLNLKVKQVDNYLFKAKQLLRKDVNCDVE